MQKFPLRGQPPDERRTQITHFALPGLLPEKHLLSFHARLRTLALLGPALQEGEETARLVREQHFSEVEASLLVPLLEAYPYYCPLEVLFAHFYHHHCTERLLETYRQQWQAAQAAKTHQAFVKPLRSVISRVRLKVRPFGLDIASLIEMGYQLVDQQQRLSGEQEKLHDAE